MIAALAVAATDWRVRTRSSAFLLAIAFALAAGYWFVPEAYYVTVDLDGHRGIYNSAWMGGMTALLCVSLLLFAGFFFVRGALVRESQFGLADVLAATPVRKVAFVIGKWLSNVLVLSAISAVIFVAAAAMQIVRAEDRLLDAAFYVFPFVLLVLPVCALVAAGAVLFDAIDVLRGFGGSIAWFVLGNAVVVGSLALGYRSATALDPLGFSIPLSSMIAALLAVAPGIDVNRVSIGITQTDGALRTFIFPGIRWTAALVAGRIGWTIAAVPMVLVAAACFDPFRRDAAFAGIRAPSYGVAARLLDAIPGLPGTRFIRAETRILLGDAGLPWCVVYVALIIAGFVAPPSIVASVILPVALIWPLGHYAALGTSDRTYGVEPLIVAAPHSNIRTVGARIFAGALVAGLPLLGIIVHYPALIFVSLAAASGAIALGSLCGTPRLFETLFIIFWYGGLNGVPIFDLAADAARAPVETVIVSAAIAVGACASALATTELRYRRA